ncbi:Mu transposase C-terminal domain-containing protein [Sinorhizobium fredii]|uniref:Mu transposase C-terminal domain-containing protein n=1 Tax=Rhizobium fredii TaxID=380 RepID=UPI003519870C
MTDNANHNGNYALRPVPESAPSIPLMTSNDRFVYEGIPLIAISYRTTDTLFFHENDPMAHKRITHTEIELAIDEGRAQFYPGFHTEVGSKAYERFGNKSVDEFKPDAVAIARFHEFLILKHRAWCVEVGQYVPRSLKPASEMPGGRSMEELLLDWTVAYQLLQKKKNEETGKVRKRRAGKKTNGLEVPTLRSFNSYVSIYESCGDDFRALIPQQKGPKRRHLQIECAESYAIWRQAAAEYASKLKGPMSKARKIANARIHEANKTRTEDQSKLIFVQRKRFENMIKKLRAFDVLAAHEGEAYAHAVFKPKMDSYDVVRPGERVEFDDWNVDCITLMKETGVWLRLPDKFQTILEKASAEKPQRIWFVGAIDAATGMPLALKATRKPCASAVVEALEMVMSDKTHISDLVGAKTPWTAKVRPENVFTDNGTPYIADVTRDAFLMSSVSLTRPPAGQAWKRPFIESLFKTFAKDLMSYFDGRTFSNVVERRDYDSVANATFIVDEFMVVVLRWLCDVFVNTPSARLNGLTPNEAWELKKRTYPMRLVPGRHQKRHIFGAKKEKSIRSEGIILHGIPYNSDALQSYRRKHGSKKLFPVRFHPRDLESISVLTEDGWLTVKNCLGVPPYICIEEWYLAKKELERLNEERSARSASTMYDGINWVHSVVDAAALRGGISPHTRSAEEMSRATEKLFEGRAITKAEAGELALLATPAPQETLLLQGRVDELPAGVLGTKEPRKKAAEPEISAAPPVDDSATEIDEDDEDSQFGDY